MTSTCCTESGWDGVNFCTSLYSASLLAVVNPPQTSTCKFDWMTAYLIVQRLALLPWLNFPDSNNKML